MHGLPFLAFLGNGKEGPPKFSPDFFALANLQIPWERIFQGYFLARIILGQGKKQGIPFKVRKETLGQCPFNSPLPYLFGKKQGEIPFEKDFFSAPNPHNP